jgi:acid phosphatase
MALYGTHDTTVAALLSTLGIFDRRWPSFTSNITLELFKSQRGGLLSFLKRDEYFVRMRYNHKVVTLPGIDIEAIANDSMSACGKAS